VATHTRQPQSTESATTSPGSIRKRPGRSAKPRRRASLVGWDAPSAPWAGYDGFGRPGRAGCGGARGSASISRRPPTLGTRDHHWGTHGTAVGGPGRYMGIAAPAQRASVGRVRENSGIWGEPCALQTSRRAERRSATVGPNRVHRMRFEPETNPAAQWRGRPSCSPTGAVKDDDLRTPGVTRSPSLRCGMLRRPVTVGHLTATSGTAMPVATGDEVVGPRREPST